MKCFQISLLQALLSLSVKQMGGCILDGCFHSHQHSVVVVTHVSLRRECLSPQGKSIYKKLKWVSIIITLSCFFFYIGLSRWCQQYRTCMSIQETKETWVLYLGSGRSPGIGKGSLLSYSRLENPMDRVVSYGLNSPQGHKESDMTEATQAPCRRRSAITYHLSAYPSWSSISAHNDLYLYLHLSLILCCTITSDI